MLYAWRHKKTKKWLVLKEPKGFKTRMTIEYTANLHEATVCGFHHIPRELNKNWLERYEAKVERKVILKDSPYEKDALPVVVKKAEKQCDTPSAEVEKRRSVTGLYRRNARRNNHEDS